MKILTTIELHRNLEGADTILIVALLGRGYAVGSVEVMIRTYTPVQKKEGPLRLARIRSLNVIPDERRKGIGGRLLSRCIELARDCETIGLLCCRQNTAAIALYRREGFAVVACDSDGEFDMVKDMAGFEPSVIVIDRALDIPPDERAP